MSLKDIAPIKQTVSIRGENIAVSGITNEGVAQLWQRFPVIAELLSGVAKPEAISDKMPEAIAAIIAAGCGFPGDAEAEAIAASLTLDESTQLLSAILPLTLPRGIGPFVESLTKLGLLVAPPDLTAGKSKADGTSLAA